MTTIPSDKSRSGAANDDAPPFGQAMDELRIILSRLDRDDVDLDELSSLVERAAELIRSCRKRIVSTELRVQQIIDELDADLNATPDEPPPRTDGTDEPFDEDDDDAEDREF